MGQIENQRAYVLRHPERVREQQRAYTLRHLERERERKRIYMREYNKTHRKPYVSRPRVQKPPAIPWRVRNPEKWAAHQAVWRAVRDGRLVQQPCFQCGSAIKVHGHHWHGYDREHWLDVAWLCPAHHTAAHAAEKVQVIVGG